MMFAKDFVRGCASHFRRVATPSNAAGLILHTSIQSGAQMSQMSRLFSKRQMCLTTDTSNKLHFQERFWTRTIHARKYCVDSKSDRKAKTLDVIKNQLEKGIVPKLRNITSLPEIPSISGKESFVGLNIITTGADGRYDLLAIAASSKSEQFVHFVNPHKIIRPSQARFMGAQFNSDTDQLINIADGQTINTVREEEALCDFLNFLKRQKGPVLLTFRGNLKCILMKFYTVTMKYPSLYSDIVSTAPVHIDVLKMVNKIGAYKGTSLQELFQSVAKIDLNIRDHVSTAVVTRLLFSHYLPKVGVEQISRSPCCESSDFHYARSTYSDLVLSKKLELYPLLILSRSGIGLDHLMFLKQLGFNTFEKYLLEVGVRQNYIHYLYRIL